MAKLKDLAGLFELLGILAFGMISDGDCLPGLNTLNSSAPPSSSCRSFHQLPQFPLTAVRFGT